MFLLLGILFLALGLLLLLSTKKKKAEYENKLESYTKNSKEITRKFKN